MHEEEAIEMIECDRCGKNLPPGGLRYVVTISVTADFDGVIEEEAGEEEIRKALEDAESRDADDLENDVHKEMAYILCKPCRDAFVKEPVGPGGKSGSPRGTIH